MASESEILAEVRLAIGKCAPHVRMFRNSQGVAWTGDPRPQRDGSLLLLSPRRVKFILAEGASDLIGLTQVVVTPDWLGRTLAVFTAAEVKRPGVKVPEHQQNFVDFVRKFGGFAGVVRSVDDARQLIMAAQQRAA